MEKDNMKKIREWVSKHETIIIMIIMVIIILMFLYLDSINFRSVFNNGTNWTKDLWPIKLPSINIDMWSSIFASVLAVFGTYYYTKKLTEKQMEQQKNQFEEQMEQKQVESIQQEEQYKEQMEQQDKLYKLESEHRLEQEDRLLIAKLHELGSICEETLYLKKTKKYNYKVKIRIEDEISKINDFSNLDDLYKTAFNDLHNMYELYENIELLHIMSQSKKYQEYYQYIITERNTQPKTIQAPRNKVKGKDINQISNQEEYSNFIRKTRAEYKEELTKIVESANKKFKQDDMRNKNEEN